MTENSYSHLLVDKRPDDGIAIMTLNRPEVLNALNAKARVEMYQAARELEADESVRAIVVTGTGRAFCAGQDLNETAELPVDGGSGMIGESWISEGSGPYEAFAYFPKPIVAAIHGYTTGDGMQTALLADIRVAADDLKMGMTEINVGIPCVWGSWIISRVSTPAVAAEVTLTGELLTAERAKNLGLVHRVVSRENHVQEAIEVAIKLASKPRAAMREHKKWMNEYFRKDLDYVRTRGLEIQDVVFGSGEPQRIMRSFVKEKVRPTEV